MESSQRQTPSEHCKFIFAVFGLNISKRKGLWKMLKSRIIRGRGGIAKALEDASKISQKTNIEFNLTGADIISSDELKQIRAIVIEYFTKLQKLKNNKTRSSHQNVALSLRLISITSQKMNDFMQTINQKWLRHYGIINSELLKITGPDHFIKIQNESKKYKKENCETVIMDALIDSSISLPSA